MQVDRSNLLRLFKGRRVAIPLLAVGVTLFVVFSGHKAIVGLAMDGMTGFLAGTASGTDVKTAEPAAAPSGCPPAVATAQEPPAVMLLAQAAPSSENVSVETRVLEAQSQAPAEVQAADSLAVAQPPVAASAPPDSAVRKTVSAYTAYFLRDPFISLVQAGKDRPAKLLDVGRAKMVGSVWGESGIIGLLEDDSGRSYALKVGDKVLDGRAISVTPASVTFSLTMYGLTKTVTLELAEEGE